MSDFELLSIVLMILGIIVIRDYQKHKKVTAPTKGKLLFC